MNTVTQLSTDVIESISSNETLTDIPVQLPIEYEGESIVINRECMKVDRPYPFEMFEHWLLAIKRDDEAIEVYYLPSEDKQKDAPRT